VLEEGRRTLATQPIEVTECAMARASYLGSARAMALDTPPLAWFCAATWPVLSPPLTSWGGVFCLIKTRSLPLDLEGTAPVANATGTR